VKRRFLTLLTLAILFIAIGCGKKSSNEAPPAQQPTAAAPPAASEPPQTPPPNALEAQQAAQAEKPPEPPKPIVVPAGTTLTVSLGTALSSKTSQPGQTFPATVSKVISVGGRTAIPSGSPAEGTVLDAKKQGAFKGEGVLALQLTSITVRGHNYPITTSTFSQTVKGKGKRTAKSVGGIAAGGALIGGLAGGGKGAAIGALAGAGAGTAVAGATGGENINLPAEAAISFKLQAPLTLQPQ